MESGMLKKLPILKINCIVLILSLISCGGKKSLQERLEGNTFCVEENNLTSCMTFENGKLKIYMNGELEIVGNYILNNKTITFYGRDKMIHGPEIEINSNNTEIIIQWGHSTEKMILNNNR